MEMLGFPKGHDDLIDALGLAKDVGGPSLAFSALGETATSPDVELPTGQELRFSTGLRIVPDHVAVLLSGFETERFTYEEAMMRANRRNLDTYIGSAIRGGLS
jgi:hypothetical protein